MALRLSAALACIALLAASCLGDDDPPPPAAPTAAATATGTPAVVATPEATATAEPTPPPTATPTPVPTATPAPTPTAEPTPVPPPVTVRGPLVVVSERVSVERQFGNREVETRRVIVRDIEGERWWSAFEYENVRTVGSSAPGRSSVQPAGPSLIVWSDRELRRMSLDGVTEAVLLSGFPIREIMVSPDGTKIAVAHSQPVALLILDAVTGEEQLRIPADHPDIGPLRSWHLQLGSWRDDGRAISVTSGGERPIHTAIVLLDGTVRMMPENARVSPDFRYALIPRGRVDGRGWYEPAWASVEMRDAETGRVLWTIADEEGVAAPTGVWWDWELHSYRRGESTYVEFDLLSVGTQLMDAATGEIVSVMAEGLERPRHSPARGTCDTTRPNLALICEVHYDGHVVWNGATGWTWYVGVIDVPRDLELGGIEMMAVVPTTEPPAPPPRDEMVGPLFAYEVQGEYEHDPARSWPRSTRRVMVHDAGSGRSWAAFAHYTPHELFRAQAALGGFVTEADRRIIHTGADGELRVLHDGWPGWPNAFTVSPDQTTVAVSLDEESTGTARSHSPTLVVIRDIASGDLMLRLTADEIAAAAELGPADAWGATLPHPNLARVWAVDSAGFLVELWDWGYGSPTPDTWHVLITLGGSIRPVPCVTDWRTDGDKLVSCLSPDRRYAVLGRAEGSRDYVAEYWRSFDITDWRAGRVLWTVEPDWALRDADWEWASEHHFAWSSGDEPDAFTFHERYRNYHALGAEVSVIDARTGEIEVMDSADYLARFHPPPRAATECPEHPAHACRILLDGEVVGEGRWPRIIGFVELGGE